MFDGQSLKEKQRTIRDGFPENLGLRVHRAISWLLRSEQETDDPDAAFLFLWIAFNACYGEDSTRSAGSGSSNERQILERYFQKILQFDTDGEIQAAVWERFSGPIRVFLDNQYVFQPFWKFYNGVPGYDNWEQSLNQARKKAVRAIGCGDTLMVLSILFDRLYVLRNQLVHGGATWNSRVNRDQVRDGHSILGFLIPRFINIMMDHPEESWGPPYYPVVND